MSQAIEEIERWVVGQCGMQRSTEEGYQGVCDHYQGFTTKLTDVTLSVPELRICKPVAMVLEKGFNRCPR